MHASNYGHNGVPSVSRYAEAFHKQRSCIHPGLLGMLTAEPRRVTTNLGCDKGTQRTRYITNTYYVGKCDLEFFQLSNAFSCMSSWNVIFHIEILGNPSECVLRYIFFQRVRILFIFHSPTHTRVWHKEFNKKINSPWLRTVEKKSNTLKYHIIYDFFNQLKQTQKSGTRGS